MYRCTVYHVRNLASFARGVAKQEQGKFLKRRGFVSGKVHYSKKCATRTLSIHGTLANVFQMRLSCVFNLSNARNEGKSANLREWPCRAVYDAVAANPCRFSAVRCISSQDSGSYFSFKCVNFSCIHRAAVYNAPAFQGSIWLFSLEQPVTTCNYEWYQRWRVQN